MKNKTQCLLTLLLTTVALASGRLSVRAADPADDKWHFSTTPFLWLSGVNGNVTAHGRKVDVDVGFDEIFDHLDSGFMTYLEYGKSKFGFYGQPNYLKLSADGTQDHLHGDATLQLWIVEAGGYCQVGKWGQEKSLTLDATAGVRYWNLHNEVELHGTGGNFGIDRGSTTTLTDPVVGMRARQYLTSKLSLTARGDFGGFGMTSQMSDFTWQAMGLVGYDFTKRFSIFGGFRALSVDKHEGNGSEKNGAKLTLNGALFGLQMRW